MIKINDPKAMQDVILQLSSKKTIGFVPTMGGLHAGHVELIKRAKQENDICVVSIFLNPTQFDNPEDLTSYPAQADTDYNCLVEAGVDYFFSPTFASIYPDDYNYQLNEKKMSSELCGRSRPGHFSGVLTIVMKLLNIIKPTRAYFGEKDFQQLQLIKGMVAAFFINTDIISVATIRDSKGLALSSRNLRLSDNGLLQAQFFAVELKKTQSLEQICKKLNDQGIRVDYLDDLDGRRYGAVEIEGVRLIDNVQI